MKEHTLNTKQWRFLIDPSAPHKTRIDHDIDLRQLKTGEALIAVDRFSFTANNILYVTLGHENNYWDIFPAPKGWGLAPAWGIGRVVASKCPDVAIGESLFGFFPLASHCTISPKAISSRHVVDTAAHREPVAAAYNRYTRIDGVDAFTGRAGDWQLLLRPLALVGMLAAHFFEDAGFYNSDQFVVTSASSKTGIGVGKMIKEIAPHINVVGLTSPDRQGFVQALGVYDQVVSYKEIEKLTLSPSIIFDLTGDNALVGRIYDVLETNLKYCAYAGRSRWDAEKTPVKTGEIQPERFFTPNYMAHYIPIWGPEVFESRFNTSILSLRQVLSSHVSLKRIDGAEELATLYAEFLEDGGDVNIGHIVSVS